MNILKASDIINHNIFITTCHAYKFNKTASQLLQVKSTFQRTKINNDFSS